MDIFLHNCYSKQAHLMYAISVAYTRLQYQKQYKCVVDPTPKSPPGALVLFSPH